MPSYLSPLVNRLLTDTATVHVVLLPLFLLLFFVLSLCRDAGIPSTAEVKQPREISYVGEVRENKVGGLRIQ